MRPALDSSVGLEPWPHAAPALIPHSSPKGRGLRCDSGPTCAGSSTGHPIRSPRRHVISRSRARRSIRPWRRTGSRILARRTRARAARPFVLDLTLRGFAILNCYGDRPLSPSPARGWPRRNRRVTSVAPHSFVLRRYVRTLTQRGTKSRSIPGQSVKHPSDDARQHAQPRRASANPPRPKEAAWKDCTRFSRLPTACLS